MSASWEVQFFIGEPAPLLHYVTVVSQQLTQIVAEGFILHKAFLPVESSNTTYHRDQLPKLSNLESQDDTGGL